MLLHVAHHGAQSSRKLYAPCVSPVVLLALAKILALLMPAAAQTPQSNPLAAQSSAASAPTAAPAQSFQPRTGLNIVVLDPAHGGTDTGARGTGGIRESEIVLEFAAQVRRALEAQGFQVVQTRLANENPSFDDRSALANAQTGAVFVTLHISSTGLPGTARVYVNSDLPGAREPNGLIPWDRAQAPFVGLSHKLGELVQGNLTQRFKGLAQLSTGLCRPPTAHHGSSGHSRGNLQCFGGRSGRTRSHGSGSCGRHRPRRNRLPPFFCDRQHFR